MKILYTTDLHGSTRNYTLIRKKAQFHQVDMIINGSDMLPKMEPVCFKQQKFIKFLQKQYWPPMENDGIHYLCTLGNDDLRIHDQLFDEACDGFDFIHNIAGRRIEIEGYEFIGFNLVPDYPFGLKDRCRMDTRETRFPNLQSKACISTPEGWNWLEDWPAYANTLPTIEDELQALVKPRDIKKTVYVIHCPPAGLQLDICEDFDRPGSQAIYDFLLENRPLISLHGHLHESYRLTGRWRNKIKDTWVVQPGQFGINVSYVIINMDTMEMTKYGSLSYPELKQCK